MTRLETNVVSHPERMVQSVAPIKGVILCVDLILHLFAALHIVMHCCLLAFLYIHLFAAFYTVIHCYLIVFIIFTT